MQNQQHASKHVMRTILVGGVLCVVGFFFIIGFMRAFIQDYAVRKEISSLEHERAELEGNKLTLLDRLNDIKSDSFVEKEARLKFGLQKPGESVILLNNGSPPIVDSSSVSSTPSTVSDISNAGRWWHYFFHSK